MTEPLLERLLSYTIYARDLGFLADKNEMYPLETLEAKRYLMPDGMTSMVSCHCHNGTDVIWTHINGRGDVPFGSCVNCEIFEIDPQRLRRWKLRLETILEQLAKKLELRGGVRPLFTNLFWRLGRKKGREYIYIRRYDPKDRRVLRDELARMPKAVLVTGNDFTLDEIQTDHDHTSFALKNVASLDEPCEMVIDFEALRDILGDDDTPDEKPKSKPTPKRSKRAVNIEKLVKELEQFLKDARDYSLTTADNGNMEFLPPPTMEDLAKRTGMSKSSIFRCINDPNEKLLRLLWEKTNDLHSILS